MSIDRLNKLLRSWRRVKAPRGKFKHRHDRSPRQVEPLHDFFDSGPGLEIFEHNGNRHPRIFEHPRAADLSGDALDSRTLGPIEDCHIPALPYRSWLRRLLPRFGGGVTCLTSRRTSPPPP